MSKNYYYLVAGLVEYTLESERKGFNALALRDGIVAELGAADRKTVELFYTFYDVENIISAFHGKQAYNPLGNLSREEVEEVITVRPAALAEDDDREKPRIPEAIAGVIRAYRPDKSRDEDETDSGIDTGRPIEASLWEAFYETCARSECRFLRDWYAFDNTLRNIITAYIAREKGLPVADQLVGRGEVTDALGRSAAADFGLRNEIEYMDQAIALLHVKNIVEKEHQLDLIRWKKAEELSTFVYFNIDFILAYLAKVNIIQRWVALDPSRGKEMFRELIKELSENDALRRAEAEALAG